MSQNPNRKRKNYTDETWVCNWCGSDNIYEEAYVPMNFIKLEWKNVLWPRKESTYTSDCCDNFDYPLYYAEWEEQIIEECNGNKDKYIAILDGSRA